jgi:hypothetical protein
MKTPANQIDRQLTQIACHQVILQAAKIYAATLDPNTDYSGFVLIGADEILCLSDEVTLATPQQRIQWQKREWMNWASSPSDLTFFGCIQWLMLRSPDADDDDCVTMEQVLAVLAGYRF